ncbi:hypothetical protein ACO1KZ_15325, partial [Staphylococcus aureus]
GKECQYLAYPYGATNPLIIKMLKKYGFRAALGTDRSGNPFFVNRFRMHRSFIFGDYDLKKFHENLVVFKAIGPDLSKSDIPLSVGITETPEDPLVG